MVQKGLTGADFQRQIRRDPRKKCTCPTIRKVGTYFVQNFGCRATQADGAALESLLSAKGLSAAEQRSAADLVVLNTCTVTSAADDDVRQTIRRVHRENPGGADPGHRMLRAARARGIGGDAGRRVGGGQFAQDADRRAGDADRARPITATFTSATFSQQHDFLSAPVEDAAGDRTRPNLKIQDGCNNRCSFCIIPFVRGRSRSAPAAAGGGTGARAGAAVPGDGAQRDQSGPLGQGAGQQDAAGGPGPPAAGGDRSGAAAAQLGRADGFLRRPAGADGGVAADREARACAAAIGVATGRCAACIASTGRGIMRTACRRRAR